MQRRSRLLNNADFSLKYVLSAVDEIQYLHPDVENVEEVSLG